MSPSNNLYQVNLGIVMTELDWNYYLRHNLKPIF